MQVFASTDWYAYVRDVVTPLLALASLFVAWQGLKTRRRQLKGTHDAEAARQLLRAALKLRDALLQNRHMHVGLLIVDPIETLEGASSDLQAQYRLRISDYYESYCKQVWDARSEFQAALFEAEALSWNDAHLLGASRIQELVDEWNLDVGMYIASLSPATTESERTSINEYWKVHRRIVALPPRRLARRSRLLCT
jgi:hypothetical protein